MPVFLPLQGPEGETPKAPRVSGWTRPDYQGVSLDYGGWVGMRCDGLVVIDCDTEDTYRAWLDHIDQPADHTLTVKTPRGYHCYYYRVEGAPAAPAVGLRAEWLPENAQLDIRAGRTSQVVVPPTPGYAFHREVEPARWDLAWISEGELAATKRIVNDGDEWSTIPDGYRNTTLFSIGSYLRRQGMDEQTIYEELVGINERRCNPPLSDRELRVIASSAAKYQPQPDVPVEIEDEPEPPKHAPIQWAKQLELPPPPEWLWEPYLPKGRLVMLDGEEGIGKGMFTVLLALEQMRAGRNVAWLTAEDDPEEDVLRRLFAAGWTKSTPGDVAFIDPMVRIPRHVDELEQLLHVVQPSLVVLDPGRSFLSAPDGTRDFNFNNDAHVRPGLQEMARIARRTDSTFVFVHHWNKATGEIRLKSSGTVAFRQVPRLHIAMQRVNDYGALAVAKANIGSTGHVRAFHLKPIPELHTVRFVLGEPLPYPNLDEWAAAMKSQERKVPIDNEDAVKSLPPGVSADHLQLTDSEAEEFIRHGLLQRGNSGLFRVEDR